MDWSLRYGDARTLRLLHKKADRGEATPLDALPELGEDEAPFWAAFWQLDVARPRGFGISGIPISEVLAYAELRGIDDLEARAEFLDMIQAMDRHRLLYHESNGDVQHGNPDQADD